MANVSGADVTNQLSHRARPVETPRTKQLNDLRQKRVAYFSGLQRSAYESPTRSSAECTLYEGNRNIDSSINRQTLDILSNGCTTDNLPNRNYKTRTNEECVSSSDKSVNENFLEHSQCQKATPVLSGASLNQFAHAFDAKNVVSNNNRTQSSFTVGLINNSTSGSKNNSEKHRIERDARVLLTDKVKQSADAHTSVSKSLLGRSQERTRSSKDAESIEVVPNYSYSNAHVSTRSYAASNNNKDFQPSISTSVASSRKFRGDLKLDLDLSYEVSVDAELQDSPSDENGTYRVGSMERLSDIVEASHCDNDTPVSSVRRSTVEKFNAEISSNNCDDSGTNCERDSARNYAAIKESINVKNGVSNHRDFNNDDNILSDRTRVINNRVSSIEPKRSAETPRKSSRRESKTNTSVLLTSFSGPNRKLGCDIKPEFSGSELNESLAKTASADLTKAKSSCNGRTDGAECETQSGVFKHLPASAASTSGNTSTVVSSLRRNSAGLEAVLGKERMARLLQNIESIDSSTNAKPFHPPADLDESQTIGNSYTCPSKQLESEMATARKYGACGWSDVFRASQAVTDMKNCSLNKGEGLASFSTDPCSVLESRNMQGSTVSLHAGIHSFPINNEEAEKKFVADRSEFDADNVTSCIHQNHTHSVLANDQKDNVRYSFKSDEIYARAEKLQPLASMSKSVNVAMARHRPRSSRKSADARESSPNTVNATVSRNGLFLNSTHLTTASRGTISAHDSDAVALRNDVALSRPAYSNPVIERYFQSLANLSSNHPLAGQGSPTAARLDADDRKQDIVRNHMKENIIKDECVKDIMGSCRASETDRFHDALAKMKTDLLSSIDNNDDDLFARVASAIEELEQDVALDEKQYSEYGRKFSKYKLRAGESGGRSAYSVDNDDKNANQLQTVLRSTAGDSKLMTLEKSREAVDQTLYLDAKKQERLERPPLTDSNAVFSNNLKLSSSVMFRNGQSKKDQQNEIVEVELPRKGLNNNKIELRDRRNNIKAKNDSLQSDTYTESTLSTKDGLHGRNEARLTRSSIQSHQPVDRSSTVGEVSTVRMASSAECKFSAASWLDGGNTPRQPFFQVALDTVRDSEDLVYEDEKGRDKHGLALLPDFLREELSFNLTDSIDERAAERKKREDAAKTRREDKRKAKKIMFGSDNYSDDTSDDESFVDSLPFNYSEESLGNRGADPSKIASSNHLPQSVLAGLKLDLRDSIEEKYHDENKTVKVAGISETKPMQQTEKSTDHRLQQVHLATIPTHSLDGECAILSVMASVAPKVPPPRSSKSAGATAGLASPSASVGTRKGVSRYAWGSQERDASPTVQNSVQHLRWSRPATAKVGMSSNSEGQVKLSASTRQRPTSASVSYGTNSDEHQRLQTSAWGRLRSQRAGELLLSRENSSTDMSADRRENKNSSAVASPVRSPSRGSRRRAPEMFKEFGKYAAMAKGYTGRLYQRDDEVDNDDDDDLVMTGRRTGTAAVKGRRVRFSADLDLIQKLSPRIQAGEVSMLLCFPDEILLRIFSELPHSDLVHCAATCHHFHRIADDLTLWRKIVLHNQSPTDEWLAAIGRRQPTSFSLIKCTGERVTAGGLRELFRQCANSLRELVFSGCSKGELTGDNILLHAVTRLRNITRLDASWSNVNENGILELSNNCERLESLCLNGCQAITDDVIRSVVLKHGQSLRCLELFGMFGLTHSGAQAIGENCPNLTTLNLGQCWKLPDSSISQLAKRLVHIENLDIRGCKQIQDHAVHGVVRNCSYLRTLSVANCPLITDSSLAELSAHSVNLRSLDVCSCVKITNIGLKSLVANCPDLEHLDFSSTDINHRGVIAIASCCGKTLQSLKLNHCKQITLDCLQQLLKNCKRLKKLSLYGVNGIGHLDNLRSINSSVVIEM